MTSSPNHRRQRRATLVILCFLLFGGLVLITRSFFITRVVLPALSNASGLSIEAETVRLGISTVQVTRLRVSGINGAEQIEVEDLTVAPAWSRLLRGHLVASDLTLRNPVIVLAPAEGSPAEDSDSPTDSKPLPPVDLRNLTLENGRVVIRSGERTLTLEDLQLVIPRISQNAVLNLQIQTGFRADSLHGDLPLQQGRLKADLLLPMDAGLLPAGLAGNLRTELDATPDLPSMTWELTPDLLFDMEDRQIDIRKLEAAGYSENSKLVDLTLLNPMRLTLGTGFPALSDTGLRLQVRPTELHLFPFASLLPVDSGTVEGRILLDFREKDQQILADLDLHLSGLTGKTELFHLQDTALHLQAEASGTTEELQADHLSARIVQAGSTTFLLEAAGNVNLLTFSGEVDLKDLSLEGHGMRNLLPGLPEISGTVVTRGRITRDGKGLSRFRLSTILTGGQLQPLNPLPSPLELTTVGQIDPVTFLLRSGQLTWPSPGGETEGIRFEGSVASYLSDAPEVQLQAEAGDIQLDPWLGILPSTAPDSPPRASRPAPAPPAPLPALPIGPSSFSLSAHRLSLQGLSLDDLNLQAAAGPTSFTVDPLEFKLQASPFQTVTSVDWSDGLPEFTTRTRLSPLELGPMADILFPEAPGAIQGVFSLRSELSGKGQSYSDLAASLAGNLQAAIREGRIRLFAPVPEAPQGLLQTQKYLETIIRTLARGLGLPPSELLDPPVDTLEVKAGIGNGVLRLDAFLAENPEFRLHASGSIPLHSTEWGMSDVEKLPVTLGVSPPLAKRVRIYREDRIEDGKIMLPPVLDLEGTLADPRINVRKRVIAGLVITGINERNEIGNENVQNALNLLGGFLSGEGPAPTPTPAPTTAPAPAP